MGPGTATGTVLPSPQHPCLGSASSSLLSNHPLGEAETLQWPLKRPGNVAPGVMLTHQGSPKAPRASPAEARTACGDPATATSSPHNGPPLSSHSLQSPIPGFSSSLAQEVCGRPRPPTPRCRERPPSSPGDAPWDRLSVRRPWQEGGHGGDRGAVGAVGRGGGELCWWESTQGGGGGNLEGPRGVWPGQALSGGAGPTFEVQVAGAVGVLSDGAGVDLERVHVAGVPGHHHVVPLVVVDGFVGVPLHQGRAVPQVEHVVDVPAPREGGDTGLGWRQGWWGSLVPWREGEGEAPQWRDPH